MRKSFWERHPIRIRYNGAYRFHTNLIVAQAGLSRPVSEVAMFNGREYLVVEAE